MLKIRLSAFLKNVLTTTLTSFLTVVCLILAMRLLAKGLGPEEFGAYSLARRIISNLAALALLSLDIALARYLAMTSDQKLQSAHSVSSLVVSGSALILLSILALSASEEFSYLIFNSHDYQNLYQASLFFLTGYCLFVITYSYYRGMQRFDTANLLQLALMAIFPLLVAFLFAAKKSSAFIVFLMGGVFYLSVIPLFRNIFKAGLPDWKMLKASLKTLLSYSLPRAPAGFALAGLLTLGPFLAAQFRGITEAGYFVIGQSVFRVVETAIVGFGLVALPKVSQLLAEESQESLKSKVEDIQVMIFQLGLFATIHIFLWSKEVILAWLGPDYMSAAPVMKIIVLSLAPYLGYVILRSIVDAVEVRAINTLNIFFSLALATGLSLLLEQAGLGTTGLALGTSAGFLTLGLLTSSFLFRRYRISFKNFLVSRTLIANIISALIVLLTKKTLAPRLSQPAFFLTGVILELALFLGYLYFFFKLNVRWMAELKKRIFVER